MPVDTTEKRFRVVNQRLVELRRESEALNYAYDAVRAEDRVHAVSELKHLKTENQKRINLFSLARRILVEEMGRHPNGPVEETNAQA